MIQNCDDPFWHIAGVKVKGDEALDDVDVLVAEVGENSDGHDNHSLPEFLIHPRSMWVFPRFRCAQQGSREYCEQGKKAWRKAEHLCINPRKAERLDIVHGKLAKWCTESRITEKSTPFLCIYFSCCIANFATQ